MNARVSAGGAGTALTTLCIALGAGCGAETPQPPPPPPPRFQHTVLDDSPGEPIGLAVLPDGRALHTTRDGSVWLHDTLGAKTLAASIPVYMHDEEGLQGIALDPDFGSNGWVYVYYSPPLATPVDDPSTLEDEGLAPEEGSAGDWARFQGHARLARFRFDGSTLDLQSEQIILQVPMDRGFCCHVGGQVDFDAAGNLLLSTGDDSNPFQSGGFTPIDERPERNPAFDAQRSASNTNDLRGKLLRIHVEADGTYTIPAGNLFPEGMASTRPEIYSMGLRNPFRFAADRRRGVVYLADYAPDAPTALVDRGPVGTGRWMIVRGPANYGWPYCATPDRAYVDHDFAARQSSTAFDCASPVNDSPRNTGLRALPPVTQPEVFYSYALSEDFPELSAGGVGPMAGPAYVYDPENPAPGKWPAEFDGAAVFYEWARDFVAAFHLTPDAALARIEPLRGEIVVDSPIDLEFGPDGALYVLGYGDGYFNANPDARLLRVEALPAASAVPSQ